MKKYVKIAIAGAITLSIVIVAFVYFRPQVVARMTATGGFWNGYIEEYTFYDNRMVRVVAYAVNGDDVAPSSSGTWPTCSWTEEDALFLAKERAIIYQGQVKLREEVCKEVMALFDIVQEGDGDKMGFAYISSPGGSYYVEYMGQHINLSSFTAMPYDIYDALLNDPAFRKINDGLSDVINQLHEERQAKNNP